MATHIRATDEEPEDVRGLNALPEATPQLGDRAGLLTDVSLLQNIHFTFCQIDPE